MPGAGEDAGDSPKIVNLIVGLGNPGRSYASDRHNVGFRCVDYIAKKYQIVIRQRRARAKIGNGEIAGVAVVLAKPQTFMNMSGEAVALLVRQFGIASGHLLVIYDDLDLPLGRLRIRVRGSSGGHKGVQSIIDCVGSEDFPRIRIGIGRPEEDAVSYVLGRFSSHEKEVIAEMMVRVNEVVYYILDKGVEAAMNRYN